MDNRTFQLRKEDVKRDWYVVDAENKTLGRLATEIAKVLSGKNKVTFTPHIDNGDFVVVTNAEKVAISGNKALQKTYFRHSMYPGGEKYTSFKMMMEKHPERVINLAVSGMLAKNKLRKKKLSRLRVFVGSEHTHTAQKPVELEIK